jgi:hypothetical protein
MFLPVPAKQVLANHEFAVSQNHAIGCALRVETTAEP